MRIRAAMEYNDEGVLLWLLDYPGAAARGASLEEAKGKAGAEAASWSRWAEETIFPAPTEGAFDVDVTEWKQSRLLVADADSDMIFEAEKKPFLPGEYRKLKELTLRSARDFLRLYESIPEKDRPLAPQRESFYGPVPRTARQMYDHTNGVTAYYLGEVGVEAQNLPDIWEGRRVALEQLEEQPELWKNPVFTGSYDEQWSPKKVLRRFLWHDRIHAKAMFRRARAIWGDAIDDPFCFLRTAF